VSTFIVYQRLNVVEVVLGLIRPIWSKVLGYCILAKKHHVYFLLVGPMTLKKLEKRVSVQAFSGWTAKLVQFLQNTRGPVATHGHSTSIYKQKEYEASMKSYYHF
jgi:hypothetical protein